METQKTWAKGSLPQWLVVMLLMVIGFFGHRTMDEIDSIRNRQALNETRITILESDSKSLREMIFDLKSSQRDVLTELRSIGTMMRKVGP